MGLLGWDREAGPPSTVQQAGALPMLAFSPRAALLGSRVPRGLPQLWAVLSSSLQYLARVEPTALNTFRITPSTLGAPF